MKLSKISLVISIILLSIAAIWFIKLNSKIKPCLGDRLECLYDENYNKLSNKAVEWWPGNKLDHQRPVVGAGALEEELKPYQAFYMGPDTKKIYLTFDEGSNDTYIKEIIGVLNKYNIKATFFLCGHYIISNPDLMLVLSSSNHSVGNHTYHHKDMPLLASGTSYKEFVKELQLNEEVYINITGVSMDKIYRPPRGSFSNRSLKIISDLGYSTYFWSASYLDYEKDLSEQEALTNMMDRYHNGAIYLLHAKNKGNYLALDTFILNMQKLGYEFGLVRDIE